MQNTQFNSWVRKIHWRRDRLPTLVLLGFPCVLSSKESTCQAGDVGSIPGVGRSHGEGNGSPLQYSCLENPTDIGVWQAIVHGVTRVGHDLVTEPPPLSVPKVHRSPYYLF